MSIVPVHGRTAPLGWLVRALPAVGLFLLAFLALALASLPFETVSGLLASLGEGFSRRYSRNVHLRVGPKLQLFGLAALGAGLLAWCLRGWLAQGLVAAVAVCRADLTRVRRQWASISLDRGTCAAVAGLVVLAAILRLACLFQPMRYDESFTYTCYASQPTYLLVAKYDYPNNHVFHSLCVHVVCAVLGDAPWVIRLPALLAGLLLVPACFVVARALCDRPTALLSSALVACSSILVEYSTNARGYGLMALFFLLLVGLGIYLLRRRSVLGWGAWAVLAALGFWTVPVMLFPFGAVVLWMGLSSLRDRRTVLVYRGCFISHLLIASALVVLLTGLLYFPVVLASGPDALLANKFVASLTREQWQDQVIGSLLSTWAQWHRDLPTGAALVLLAGCLAAIGRHLRLACGPRPAGRQSLSSVVPLAGMTLAWCAVLVVGRRINPYERIWLFALPLYLMVASAGLVALARAFPLAGVSGRPARWAVGTLVVLLGLLTLTSRSVQESTDTGTLRDADAVALFLKDRLGPEDRVLAACPSDAPLEFYFDRHRVPSQHLIAGKELPGWSGARLLVVVNRTHEQTLASLAERYRLDRFVDLTRARLVQSHESAEVYEIPARSDRLARRGANEG